MRKSTTGPCSAGTSDARADPLDRDDRLAGALGRLGDVSAWRMPVAAKLVELLKSPSPVRWKVLLVEPCSPGQVPVASVCPADAGVRREGLEQAVVALDARRHQVVERRHRALVGVLVDQVRPHAVGGEEDRLLR